MAHMARGGGFRRADSDDLLGLEMGTMPSRQSHHQRGDAPWVSARPTALDDDSDDDVFFAQRGASNDRQTHAQTLMRSITEVLGPRNPPAQGAGDPVHHHTAHHARPTPGAAGAAAAEAATYFEHGFDDGESDDGGDGEYRMGRDDTLALLGAGREDSLIAEDRRRHHDGDAAAPALSDPFASGQYVPPAVTNANNNTRSVSPGTKRQSRRHERSPSQDAPSALTAPFLPAAPAAPAAAPPPPATNPTFLPDIPDFWAHPKFKERARVGGMIFAGFVVLLGLILIIASLTPVERQHFGIRYNPNTGRIDDSRAYENGLHFWSPAAVAITVPSFWRRVCFDERDLEVATATGQTLQLDVCFRYMMTPEAVRRLIRVYARNEEAGIRAIAQDTLKTAAVDFTFQQYVQQRESVTDGLHAALVAGLERAQINVVVPRPAFILGYVRLPSAVLALNQQVYFQGEYRLQNEFNKQATVIRLDTEKNTTQIRADADVVLQEARAAQQRMREAAAHNGTARLQATSGELLLELAFRLGVASQPGYHALAKYALFLDVLEGGTTEISPDATTDIEGPHPHHNVMLLDLPPSQERAVIPET